MKFVFDFILFSTFGFYINLFTRFNISSFIWNIKEGSRTKKGYKNHNYLCDYERIEIFTIFRQCSDILNSRQNIPCPKIFWENCCRWLCRCICEESFSHTYSTASWWYSYIYDWSIRYWVHLSFHKVEIVKFGKCTWKGNSSNLFTVEIWRAS